LALEVETGTFDADSSGTGNATQDVTVGFDPKALIIWGVWQKTTNADSSTDTSFSRGICDDADNNASISFQNENGIATTDSRRKYDTTNILEFFAGGTATLVKTATCALGTAKFTLTWVTNDSQAVKIHWMAFGGADITGVEVGTFAKSTNTSVPVVQTITTASDTQSITAGQGIVFLLDAFALNEGVGNNIAHNFGMATKTDEEFFAGYTADDGNANSEPRQNTRTNKIMEQTIVVNGNLISSAEFNGFNSSGFDLNWTTNDAQALIINYLIIKGGSWQIGDDTHKITTTGTKTTSTAFQPKGLFINQTGKTSDGVAREDVSYNVGACTSTTTETAGGMTDEDLSDPINLGSMSNITKVARVLDASDQSVLSEAELNANFSASEFVLNYTTVDANAYIFGWMVCADAPAAGGFAHSFGSIMG